MNTLVRGSIYKEDCPKCGAANFFETGDPTDITGVDIDALRCWKCKHEWLTEGAEDWATLEDGFIEDGRKKP